MTRTSESFEQVHRGDREENPEEIIRRNLLRPQDQIQELYDRLAREFNQARIQMTDPRFREVFGDATIERDLKIVAAQREEFGKLWSEKELPKALEALLAFDLAELGWFGDFKQEVFVTPASEFDDYNNMTDLVIEFAPQKKDASSSFIALVDITTSEDLERLYDGWRKIQSAIANHNMGRLSYYISQKDGKVVWVSAEKQKNKDVVWVRGVPHIIIFVPRRIAEELIILPGLQDEYRENRTLKNAFLEKLEFHPFREVLRAQIFEFLRRSREYAKKLKTQRKGRGQEGNIQTLDLALDRLRELEYPTKISDPEVRQIFDKAFPIS